MLHLVKLELKKYKLNRHVLGTILVILCIMAFITISLVDSATDLKQTKDTYESTLMAINLLLITSFLIYSSVLVSQLIINEYKNKTIMLLFSYPVNRRKLIMTKLLIVSIFTIVSMTVGYLCCTFYLIFLDQHFDLVQGAFQIGYLYTYIPQAVTSIIISGFLALLPFVAGMIKKSVPVTIISSFLVVFLRQVLISSGTEYKESLPQMIVVIILVLLAVKYTFHTKVNELDTL